MWVPELATISSFYPLRYTMPDLGPEYERSELVYLANIHPVPPLTAMTFPG